MNNFFVSKYKNENILAFLIREEKIGSPPLDWITSHISNAMERKSGIFIYMDEE